MALSNRNKQAVALIIYGVVCFITALFLSLDVAEDTSKSLSNKGGLVGPINIDKANAVYELEIEQPVSMHQWSYVEVEVLDQNKDYLFSFSDELWKEEGYDSEGYWSESKTSFDMEMVFPKPGNYYFKVISKNSALRPGNIIRIRGTRELGSNTAFIIMAIVSFILGFALLRSN